MIQSLRVLEIAAGLALLLTPDKAEEFLKPLGVEAATIHNIRDARGLKDLLS